MLTRCALFVEHTVVSKAGRNGGMSSEHSYCCGPYVCLYVCLVPQNYGVAVSYAVTQFEACCSSRLAHPLSKRTQFANTPKELRQSCRQRNAIVEVSQQGTCRGAGLRSLYESCLPTRLFT